MSSLGYFASRLDRQQTRLERLSEALLVLRAWALGELTNLGATEKELQTAQSVASEFINELLGALKSGEGDEDMKNIVTKIRDGRSPDTDWMQDLEETQRILGSGRPLTEPLMERLREAVGMLRQQFAEGSNRIRPR